MMKTFAQSKTFLDKRKDFLNWLLRASSPELWEVKKHKNANSYFVTDYISPIALATLSKEGELSEWTTYDGLNFSKEWNTRQVQPNECVLEFDCEPNRALMACGRLFYALLKKGIHFAVFFAEGMRSPHFRIYDLLPDGLTREQQRQARILFARSVVSWEDLAFLDMNLLETEHSLQLEFAKHYYYGTMFKLLGEWA